MTRIDDQSITEISGFNISQHKYSIKPVVNINRIN